MDSTNIIILIISILGSVGASSGFWAWMQKRSERNNDASKMILGIAHDRLTYLTLLYINQGSISSESYENLEKYLYEPYKALGGNGTVARLMEEVRKLPIRDSIYFKEGEEKKK